MTPAAHAAVLLPGALPFLTMIIAWLWLGHKPAPSRRAALVVVLVGIILTAADSFSRGPQLTGRRFLAICFFYMAHLSWAVFSLLLGRYAVMPLAATVATTLGSAVVYLPGMVVVPADAFDQAPVSEILSSSVIQGVLVVFVAMLLLYIGGALRLGIQTVVRLVALVPVFSALAAVPFRGEPL